MNIGVVTSGGDAPGMNPCLAQLVKEGCAKGHQMFGYKRGFLGIRDNDFIQLQPRDVQDWHKRGGTMLKTGRMPELQEIEWQQKLIAQLDKNKIEALVVLGGDGSFRGALDLHKQNNSINIIGIPCTIDNNVYGSDYTLGYDTAINKQVNYLDDISDSGMAMPGRVFFVETLGACDGYLPHSSVLMGMADFSVLVERPMTNEEICQKIKECAAQDIRDYVMVTFAEGAYQMFEAAEYVRKKLGLNVKCNMLGYQQRGGAPTAIERLHAAAFAKYAINAIENKNMNKYIVFCNGKYGYMEIGNAKQRRPFDNFEF